MDILTLVLLGTVCLLMLMIVLQWIKQDTKIEHIDRELQEQIASVVERLPSVVFEEEIELKDVFGFTQEVTSGLKRMPMEDYAPKDLQRVREHDLKKGKRYLKVTMHIGLRTIEEYYYIGNV